MRRAISSGGYADRTAGNSGRGTTLRIDPHVYRAVALDRVLSPCGFDEGPGGKAIPPTERRPGWRQIVIAQPSDGVVAVFTCAELMPQMGKTQAVVAWAVDGETLLAPEGPLRIIVISDLKGSRRLRRVGETRVVDVLQRIAKGADTATLTPRLWKSTAERAPAS